MDAQERQNKDTSAPPTNSPIVVFGDGACSGNPGPGGWGVIVVLPTGQVREFGGRHPATTNNQMELTAAIEGLKALRGQPGAIEFYTDSVYVIQGITQWIWAWRNRGWKTAEGKDVANVEFWKALSNEVFFRKKDHNSSIEWKYVRGHSGIPGNERVDEIAVSFSQKTFIELYHGPLLQYPVAVFDLPENTSVPERKRDKSAGGRSAAPYSYLSLVDGKPMRHSTWKECEARVKGRPGVKFKKAATAQEEEEILRSWGIEKNF
jgi:ribonuclease HI